MSWDSLYYTTQPVNPATLTFDLWSPKHGDAWYRNVKYYVHYSSTVNVCSLDLSKAFDKMSYHSLFIKLMERHILTNILSLLEQWFAVSVTCVKMVQ